MASAFTIRAVNDWRAAVHTDFATAQRVSMDVWRRSATEATKHLLILMAQSARALTKQSPKRRKVMRDEHGEYVERWKNGIMRKDYRWMHSDARRAEQAQKQIATWGRVKKSLAIGSWEDAQTIRNRGLAKRSWMWGFGKGKILDNVTVVSNIRSGNKVIGYELRNRLSYIDRIMPSGYQQQAEQKAISKLMKQAEMKMVREFERAIGRRSA